MLDFKTFPKIDAHIHLNANGLKILELADNFNFSLLTINTEVPEFPTIQKQQQLAIENQTNSSPIIFYASTISTGEIFTSNWIEYALEKIESDIKNGACGVKFWKNIGMSIQRPDGSFLMLNDQKMKSLFDYLEKENIPVLGHQGEPKNCWLPVNEMTVKSDREYYSKHPRYHMYKQKNYPDYWEHIKARDAILNRHPNLDFVGLHLGSLEWNLEKLAERLNKFPNFNVDLAERFSHLYYHTSRNRKKVKDFFESYQDRIIYGTDIIVDPGKKEKKIVEELTRRWINHWEFLSTDKELFSEEIEKNFRGLNLSKNVLKKIYFQNVIRTYKLKKI